MKKLNGLCDFHTHTAFSTDSDSTPESMIEEAIRLGLSGICITDHNDFDFPAQYGKDAFQLDYPVYLKKLLELREKYRDQIAVYIGVEQGLQAHLKEKTDKYDSEHALDFIIGSSHLIDGYDPYYKEYWERRDAFEGTQRYFESILENLSSCSNFDVYGHMDYIVRYAPGKDATYDYRKHQELIEAILRKLIDNGKGIELNTAGLKYGLKEAHPCLGILKMYRLLGGEIITTGSDGHKPEHLAYDFNKVPEILRAAGFDYYTIFKERKPFFYKLP